MNKNKELNGKSYFYNICKNIENKLKIFQVFKNELLFYKIYHTTIYKNCFKKYFLNKTSFA